MRVTIVGVNYAPEQSGIAPYTVGLAEGLARRGHDVHVVTSVPHYPEWKVPTRYESAETSIDNGVRLTRVRPYVPTNPTAVRRALFEFSFGVKASTRPWGTVDAVVCVSPALIASATAIARTRVQRVSRPAVGLWMQDLYGAGIGETGTGGATVAASFAILERACAAAVDGVAVIHERFRDRLIRQGTDAAKIEVIRNWTHVRPAPCDRETARRMLGWRRDEVVVLHAGAMGVKQALESVIKAAEYADQSMLPMRFVLMGQGSQRSAIEMAAQGIKRVQIMDPVEDALFMRVLAAADVLLVNERPGVSDMAVPSKLTSYMAAGRPVLAATTRNSATAAEVEASGCGERIDPADPGSLVQASLRLAHNADLATTYGQRGQLYCSEVLSEPVAIANFERWIQTLCSRNSRMVSE